jgi:alkyl hydroperoxide reductase subunit AhpC
MSLRLNTQSPNFEAETTQGWINFHEWIGDAWVIFFSHPKDFTPVCTTELASLAGLLPQFAARNTKVIGLSADPVSCHSEWAKDIEAARGNPVTYPLIADPDLVVAELYDMLPDTAGDDPVEAPDERETLVIRSVFIIGPDKRIKASLSYPFNTGRNFDEIIRLLDSCQVTAKYRVATPANWHHGEEVIVLPGASPNAQEVSGGRETSLPYVRLAPDPSFGTEWFESLPRR